MGTEFMDKAKDASDYDAFLETATTQQQKAFMDAVKYKMHKILITNNATEQGGHRMSKTNDVRTDIRREVFQQPFRMDNEDYEKMSLNDSKRLLGRDE